MAANSRAPADAGRAPDPPGAGSGGLFIPAAARPAVVADLAKTAWQVAAALEAWETSRR
ncbi:hypothetical protein [Amycolatopsis sp.]|uniref:hypothetical protein n=1 Tax=Amycolatopsis sp. TaxID=37632 RepID=UPI002D7F6057|nr:hypothetical protein [Amycolatopsis sp.]HET6710350.1 hypothetical protein [Amycolatopsis sp.]